MCPLIQHTFGFTELNKVASGMGIQCLLLLSADGRPGYFLIRFRKNFPCLGYTSPFPPNLMSHIRLLWRSCAASPGVPFSTCLIGHWPAATWTYSDILLVQYPDYMCLVIFPEPSRKFTAADQVPAYRDQPALVLVA